QTRARQPHASLQWGGSQPLPRLTSHPENYDDVLSILKSCPPPSEIGDRLPQNVTGAGSSVLCGAAARRPMLEGAEFFAEHPVSVECLAWTSGIFAERPGSGSGRV